jgi:hypothetical protein
MYVIQVYSYLPIIIKKSKIQLQFFLIIQIFYEIYQNRLVLF